MNVKRYRLQAAEDLLVGEYPATLILVVFHEPDGALKVGVLQVVVAGVLCVEQQPQYGIRFEMVTSSLLVCIGISSFLPVRGAAYFLVSSGVTSDRLVNRYSDVVWLGRN